MGSYVPTTPSERAQMLERIGVDSVEALFANVPGEMILKDGLAIPSGLSELEVDGKVSAMAAKNKGFPTVFRGAGAYKHYIPAIVQSVAGKEAFLTAYTPYQPEISQGILQSIFEYQTMICQLTGMDVSNASVYDGASAAAEAVAMCRERKRTKALVSGAANPQVIETIKTYCFGAGTEVVVLPCKDGTTDLDALKAALDDTTACVYIQQPNYFGLMECAEEIGELAHAAKAKYIMGVNPIALAMMKTPAECGADVAVGEGQPLGMPLSFGGPYLGFMAATSTMMRKLPGRIAGETTDAQGRRGFVLTLQAREQHIRREKASSNVCSNQALCALTAAVYMSAMGEEGMRQAAVLSMSKAHYMANELAKIGLARMHGGEFFHEFVTAYDGCPKKLLSALEDAGILGGLPVEGGILWCCTELNTKEEIDRAVSIIRGVL